MLNHHVITKLIISLTLTLLQCYFFNTLSVDYIYTGSVDLTLEVLLCRGRGSNKVVLSSTYGSVTEEFHEAAGFEIKEISGRHEK